MLSVDYFKLFFFRIYFRKSIKVSNSLGLDIGQHFVGSDLGPNWSLKLSADRQMLPQALISFQCLSGVNILLYCV